MNPSIVHTLVLVNYQTTWSQPITPIVPSKTNMLPTSTYPMWYNVISPFVALDLGDSLRRCSLKGDPPRKPPSIHLLDLLDCQHLIHICLYHHGINHMLCNLFQSQPPSCHIGSYNTQPMSKTLI